MHNGRLVKGQHQGHFPLKGLSLIFSKIKKDQKLEEEEIAVLTKFIDEFTTVSTHGPTVGENISSQLQKLTQETP